MTAFSTSLPSNREKNETGKRWQRVLAAVLLIAAVAEFSVRGPLRSMHQLGWNDFLFPYIQAKAWARGQDAYSSRSIISFWPSQIARPLWVDSDVASGTLERKRGIPTPYPPTSFVVLAPFSALPWLPAEWIWIAINSVAVALMPFALLSLCNCQFRELRALWFLAAAFALAPLHTGLATENPAMLAVSLTVYAVWAAHSDRRLLAGVLLAVALCLKPTVAAGLLLYYVIRREWKTAGTAVLIAAAAGLIAVLRFELAGVPWLASYRENASRIFAAGSLADFTNADRVRFNMIHAQVFFATFIRSATAVNLLARSLGAALVAAWVWLCLRSRGASALLEIGAISVASLIPFYHRFYDAALLLWPLAWALLGVRRRIAAGALLMMAPFLVPGPALLGDLAASGRIPPRIVSSWWWNTIVLSHEAWILICLALLLLYWIGRASEDSMILGFALEGNEGTRAKVGGASRDRT